MYLQDNLLIHTNPAIVVSIQFKIQAVKHITMLITFYNGLGMTCITQLT